MAHNTHLNCLQPISRGKLSKFNEIIVNCVLLFSNKIDTTENTSLENCGGEYSNQPFDIMCHKREENKA